MRAWRKRWIEALENSEPDLTQWAAGKQRRLEGGSCMGGNRERGQFGEIRNERKKFFHYFGKIFGAGLREAPGNAPVTEMMDGREARRHQGWRAIGWIGDGGI